MFYVTSPDNLILGTLTRLAGFRGQSPISQKAYLVEIRAGKRPKWHRNVATLRLTDTASLIAINRLEPKNRKDRRHPVANLAARPSATSDNLAGCDPGCDPRDPTRHDNETLIDGTCAQQQNVYQVPDISVHPNARNGCERNFRLPSQNLRARDIHPYPEVTRLSGYVADACKAYKKHKTDPPSNLQGSFLPDRPVVEPLSWNSTVFSSSRTRSRSAAMSVFILDFNKEITRQVQGEPVSTCQTTHGVSAVCAVQLKVAPGPSRCQD
ncbi:hypothetical protein Bbelb_342500 [Branchiostoma belcheri]|nr:hypothetical protein Bbelb_342500 [Branchiostoma belcheri]